MMKIPEAAPPISSTSSVVVLLPGAVQGATSILLGHPFDTVKTRMQASNAQTRQSLLRTATTILRKEGPIAFYRGVSPPLLITSTKRSIQLSVWEGLKALPEPEATGTSTQAALWKLAHPCVISPFGAGALAGAVGTVLGCPMNVIKIQTQNVTREQTRNAFDCAVNILRVDGFLGFYRGLSVQLAKDVSFAGFYLGMYDKASHAVDRALDIRAGIDPNSRVPPQGTVKKRGEKHHHHHAATPFWAGLIASMMTWTLLFPMDTAKTFVQARQPLSKLFVELKAQSTDGALRRVYKGLPAALLRAGPVTGVTMMLYELVKDAVG